MNIYIVESADENFTQANKFRQQIRLGFITPLNPKKLCNAQQQSGLFTNNFRGIFAKAYTM